MRACPNCNQENPDGFRFCGSCGRELPEGAAVETRKLVTCVFCDVSGSTALGEALDPEAIRAIMTRYFGEMQSVLESHGGTVEKFVGDAVMAVFGIPEVHEDDALRAVRAASDMKARMEQLNEELEARYGTKVRIRTGVNTGEVLAGDSSQSQAFASGDTVNLAARLEQAAPPDEILLGDTTYRLVRDAIEAEAVEPLELKGKSKPVPAWKLIGVSDARYGRSRSLSSELVGRADELTVLMEVFADAVAGARCRLATVVGAAGVGKTRLTMEFLDRVQERALVLQGRCLSYGKGMTFWPIREVVAQAAGIDEVDSAETALGKIEKLLPGDELKDAARRTAGAVGLVEAGGDIHETFWGIRKLFETLAAERPVVVALDDIHWGEPTFLDLLEYIAHFTTGAPLMIVCSARPDLLQARPSWSASPGSTSVSLQPLSETDSAILVRNLLDDSELPEAVRALVLDSAEGNPLFAEELLRMLVDDGVLVRDETGWKATEPVDQMAVPPTINALMTSRLDRLGPAEREVIRRAGIVGVVFWWGAVTELTPDPLKGAVGSHLQELVRRDLIRPDASSFFNQDAFRFGHGLIREAAYQSVTKSMRAELHEHFAEWLIRLTRDSGTDYDEMLGYHLEQSYRYRSELGLVGEDVQRLGARAAEYLMAAGWRSLDQDDVPAAANLLGRAWALRGDDPRKLPDLVIDLVKALLASGRIDSAESIIEEAKSMSAGDKTLEAYVAAAEFDFLRASSSGGGVQTAVLRVVDDLLEVFRARGDDAALSAALRLKAMAHWDTGSVREAVLASEEGLAAAKGSPRHETMALFALAVAMSRGPLPVSEGLRKCDELEARARGRKMVIASVLSAKGTLLAMSGRFDEARELAYEGDQILLDLGETLEWGAQAGQATSGIELLAGDLDAAERITRETCRVLEAMSEKGYLSTGEATLALIHCERGQWEEAVELSRRAERHADDDDFMTHQLWRRARAKAYARQSRQEEAVALAREAFTFLTPGNFLEEEMLAWMDLSEVLALAGRVDQAIAALHSASALARQKEHKVLMARISERLASLASIEKEGDPGGPPVGPNVL